MKKVEGERWRVEGKAESIKLIAWQVEEGGLGKAERRRCKVWGLVTKNFEPDPFICYMRFFYLRFEEGGHDFFDPLKNKNTYINETYVGIILYKIEVSRKEFIIAAVLQKKLSYDSLHVDNKSERHLPRCVIDLLITMLIA